MLEIVDHDWESLGSTTFKREEMVAEAEPDDCYYIEHHAAVRGKQRLDLTVDPPPDLVIEVDITSATRLHAYEALGVAEWWRYADEQLTIFVLHGDHYNATDRSPTFPHVPLVEELPRFIALSRTAGTRAMLRAFRTWVREQHGGEETKQ